MNMPNFSIQRILVTLLCCVVALVVLWNIWDYYINAPWTRDARVRADVVSIAPDVSGLVSEVLVHDNQEVKAGDILFRVDRRRFELGVEQAEAAVAAQQATLDQARRDLVRSDELKNIISKHNTEQAHASEETALANLQVAVANLNQARLNLERSDVRASVNGLVTNFDLQPGDYVTTGKAEVALLDTDSLRIEGYFEETKLARINLGDPVRIHLMGQKGVIEGHVESMAAGIEDRERTPGTGLLANINPTFSWVRLAQRVPIRIAIDKVPEGVRLISGLTATVTVTHGK